MDLTILQPPSDYPDEWFRTDFDHFATLQRGKDLTRDHFRSGSIPVAGSNGIIGYHDTANVKGPGITVGRSGSVGKVAFYQEDFWAHNTALFVKDFHGNVPAFTAFFLNFLWLGRFGSGASVPTLDRNVFRTLPVVIPPPCEQQKIADVLGLVQRAIEQQELLIALTTELKKTLLHKLFTEGLRGEPQKQTEIGPVPESWEVVEFIKAVEQIDYGISAPIPKTPPENGVKIVSTADITKDGRLLYDQIRRIEAPEKTVKRLTLQTGDVLFNWRNSAELIGKSAVFQEQSEPHVFASFILRIKCGEKKSHNFFLAHLMNHYRQTSVFLKLARRAVNQANYNRNEISVLKIPLPTYQEQRKIADAIGTVDAKIQHHRQKRSKLEDLFRTLLHQLMTAQIRVDNLDLPDVSI